MASLANQTISSSYDGLIKTNTDNAIPASGNTLLQDGSGNDLALSLGRANQGVTVTGTLTATSLAGTITTAAQPNITSVGTLTSLDVGNINMANALPTITMTDTDLTGVYSRIRASSGGLLFEADEANQQADTTIRFEIDGSEAMRIDSSGSVGIGTASPSAGAVGGKVLHLVNSGATASIRVDRSDASTSGTLSVLSGNTTNAIYSTGSKDLTISTNSSERIRINSSGNVGIGTSSPADKLDVNGAIRIGDQYELKFGGTTASIFGSSSLNQLRLYTNNTERLRIDSSGRVGIGTSSPSSLLHIQSNSSPTLTLDHTEKATWGVGDVIGKIDYYTSDASGNAPYSTAFIQSENETGAGTLPSGALVFGTATYNAVGGAVERMRIDSSGTVSFAAASSLSSAVASIGHLSSNGYMYIKGGTGGLILGDDSTASRIQIEDNSNIRFETVGSERMRVESGGNVRHSFNPGSGTYYWQDTTNGASMFYLTPATYVGTAPFNNNRIIAANSSNITLEAGGAEVVSITKDGYVRLNSSNMSYPLNVRSKTDNGDLVYFERVVSGTSYLSRIYMGTPNLYIDSGGTGGVQLTNGATSWTSASDINLKKDIVELSSVLDKIDNKRCVSYRLKSQDFEQKNIGFIAQDWQEDFPEVVQVNDMDGTLGMTYTETIPILLKAIQELKAEVESLKSQINA